MRLPRPIEDGVGLFALVQAAHDRHPDLVLVMVEINASRGDRTLHNYATHCLFVRDGLVIEWWMVESLPADSDALDAAVAVGDIRPQIVSQERSHSMYVDGAEVPEVARGQERLQQ